MAVCSLQEERSKQMSVIELRALEIVVSYLPKIANELKRIADAMEIAKAVAK